MRRTTAGWDLLGHTRSRLLEISPSLPPERANAAWHELYAAEGSDWFWWYGDDFDTAYKEEFDRLVPHPSSQRVDARRLDAAGPAQPTALRGAPLPDP